MTYPEDIMEAARETARELRSAVNWNSNGSIEHIAAALLAERKRCAIVALNAPMRFAGQTEEHVRRKLADAIMGGGDE